VDSIKQKILRTPRTWTDILPITYILAFVLFFVASVMSSILNVKILTHMFTSDPDVQEFMKTYVEFLGSWIVIVGVCFLKGNRPMLGRLFPKKAGKYVYGILIGGLIGFVLNSINVVGSILLGDLKLYFDKIEILPIIGFILFIGVQSGAEEILDRLYIYEKLRRRYKNPFVAVFGNALFFLLLHLGNDGINVACLFELFIWGVFFALLVLYFDNIWLSIACHTAWNFTQNIFYGLPNSGIVSKYSIFKLDAASDGFFFDTGFGVEGSWGGVIILTVICIILIAKYKTFEKNDIWKDWHKPSRLGKKKEAVNQV